MADRADDRLKPSADNEGVAESANSETTTDPRRRRLAGRPELSRNEPPSSRRSGEKRRVPSSPEAEDGGQTKKAKPFTMSFGVKAKGGGGTREQDKGAKSGGIAAKPLKTVSLKLMQKPKEPEVKLPASKAVVKAFAEDSDDDEEEMPPEARMRMKNVGRNTPTSAGPNSYNKSKIGFNDHARVWKKSVDAKCTNPDGSKK